MSEFETAIRTIMGHYDRYSGKTGINVGDFKKMVPTHLNHMLTDTRIEEKVKELFRKLDQNQDKVIDFDEYWELIGAITDCNICHRHYLMENAGGR